MSRLLFILQRISVTNIILSNLMFISVLPVGCCALLNFESFIHGHFLSQFFLLLIFSFVFNMFLFCSCCFLWFGLHVPLNGIKKYLA